MLSLFTSINNVSYDCIAASIRSPILRLFDLLVLHNHHHGVSIKQHLLSRQFFGDKTVSGIVILFDALTINRRYLKYYIYM